MDLDQETVESILLETFGFDVKSKFLREKWNDSWNEATCRKNPTSPLPLPKEHAKDEIETNVDEFKEVPQKLTFSRINYYIGRESTDRDTEKEFKSWKMIKRNFMCRDPKAQAQRNHFSSAPERDLDFAQASFCPTETRKCDLFYRPEDYVLTSAGASWDLTYCNDKDTVRKRTEEILKTLNDHVSIFSFLRRIVESKNMNLETIKSSELYKFGEKDNDEFLQSNGFCVRDENGSCIALATCRNEDFDPNVSLNLTEDDAIDCSHLPFWGSNFS